MLVLGSASGVCVFLLVVVGGLCLSVGVAAEGMGVLLVGCLSLVVCWVRDGFYSVYIRHHVASSTSFVLRTTPISCESSWCMGELVFLVC